MMKRILPITRKEVIHIRRDPRSLYLAIGMPVVLLLLFGYAITFDVRHVPLGIIDLDQSVLSRDFISRVRTSEYFDLRHLSGDYGEAEALLDTGRVNVIAVFPRDYARNAGRGSPPPIQLLVDGSNNNTALVALGYLSRLIQEFASEILTKQMGRQAGAASVSFPSIDPRVRVWFNPELRSANFVIPGLIAVVMMVMTTMLTSLTVAREWENGTMEQLMAGPVHPAEIVIGKLIPYFILGLAQVALVVFFGTVLFKVPLKGNLFCLFTVSSIFLLCGLGIGLFLSIAVKSQQLAFEFSVLTTLLPSYILSGFMFPISSMPKIIQLVTVVVPARYFLATLRGIFLKGYNFPDVWPELVALTAFGLLMLLACVKKLKLRLD